MVQAAASAGLGKTRSQEVQLDSLAGRDGKRSPPRRPRSCYRLSRHSSRGSSGKHHGKFPRPHNLPSPQALLDHKCPHVHDECAT